MEACIILVCPREASSDVRQRRALWEVKEACTVVPDNQKNSPEDLSLCLRDSEAPVWS